mmetsp:Transcript_7565/g.11253  ORF Transcript_7565/g.11253 Transcript_7565/m.11253 type:complete len:149 (-) Transcript_7565:203-649(-)|eukprot:CAMPEP_0116033562 /NCGR_PEP_ID=MMETSP0321-20121206/19079_1 /TAXON_ID=163516 /ORGANISM="Leptocylindrus danicus var. danicus, Strain B650" /LENGTH=148 /DNA_ID=CAMNT_0003509693 /DNA_START=100 /DNA_END=546 /DNA_ORIENTATION=+
MTKRVIILVSNGISERKQASAQNNSLSLLNARRVLYEVVDGADPAQVDRRNELFRISGIRGLYPQWFIHDDDLALERPRTTYVGDWEAISLVNDCDDIPKEVLDKNPQIVTWNKMFGEVATAEPVVGDHPFRRSGNYIASQFPDGFKY